VDSKSSLDALADGAFAAVLAHVDEAVLVLDADRTLRFANPSARRLLGYRDGEAVGGRCRATTRGVDCESACPLTYALASRLDRVEDFETVYHTRDGNPLPLAVTVIPLHGTDGGLLGAVEILRPREPHPGVVLAGRSRDALELRGRARRLADNGSHVAVIGEPAAAIDVARTIHRLSGVDGSLFFTWTGDWSGIEPWPPGTMYADGGCLDDALVAGLPDGWRLIVGLADGTDPSAPDGTIFETIELPALDRRREDLSDMVMARLRELRPEVDIAVEALERLVRVTRDGGLDRLDRVARAAVSVAGGRVEVEHLAVDGYGAGIVDEVLQCDDPLAALEARLLQEVLERCEWRVQEAADRLGVSRVTLWRKMREHGIERPGCAGNGSNGDD
jgi:PAS domain S-box-containing protein